jgi:subtilisin family serine protease
MFRSMYYRVCIILLLAGLILGALQPMGGEAFYVRKFPSSDQVQGKIELLVLQEIETQGNTDFFIWLREKADLKPAAQIETKLEKGRFVFNALYTTAEQTQQETRSFLDRVGVSYRAFYIANKILVQNGDQDLLTALADRPDVEKITANHKYFLDQPEDKRPAADSATTIEPNLAYINADDVWAMGYNGDGIVLAANDTGLEVTHPAIAPHYRGCLNPPTCSNWDHNYNWWDATGTYPTDPHDGFGHGTHVTGIMIGDDLNGNQIGVAPGARTVHCKNMTDEGSSDDATLTECFQWDLAPWDLNGENPATALAPDAVNNSWGYWSGGQPLFKDEIQALHAAGILVEVSAGGDGSECSTIRSPGDYWEVLTTGAVDNSVSFPGNLYAFSARGPSDLDGNYFPDILAPGQNIRSAVPGNNYQTWSGTSMAGPHATALVGLLWDACPSLRGLVYPTIDYILQAAAPLIDQTGSNCGGDYINGPNNDWGEGTIDALATVQLVLESCAPLVETAWEKQIWVNAQGPYNQTQPISTSTGDEVLVVDRALVTATTPINFVLSDIWQAGLDLTGWQASQGNIITGTGVITWVVSSGLSETWYTITKTFEVLGGIWSTSTLTENLWVDWMIEQLDPVEVSFHHRMPNIVAPLSVNMNVYAGELITVERTITNVGDDDLIWQISITPTVSWLALDTVDGTTPPGESYRLILTLDASILEIGEYMAELEIVSNDPDVPLIIVPVILSVQAPLVDILLYMLPFLVKH